MTLASRLAVALVVGVVCSRQPLRAQGIPVWPEGQGPVAASAVAGSAKPEESIGEFLARQEQQMYLQRVGHARVAATLLTRDGATSRLEKLIAQKKAFDENAGRIMTLHVQTLESVGAPQFELEVPSLYAEWSRTMSLMDRAESASLYRPPEDLRRTLIFWRGMQEDRAAIDAAPWVHGPSEVTLDPNLAAVTIPAGVWYLDSDRCSALAARRTAIRRAARAEIGGSPVPPRAEVDRHGAACLMAADKRWSGLLGVVSRGRMDVDAALGSRAGDLLQRLRSRLNPVNNLKFANDGAYSEAAVRWLVSPEVDAAASTLRWARTNGAQKEPIGIEYAFMAFGASQQVVVSTQGLRAAEIVARIDGAPSAGATDPLSAESTVARVQEDLAPLEASLQFLPGHRYRDGDASAVRHPNDVDSLITGAPSPMEKGVQRILAEQQRKENFFSFLSDHPRYLVALLGAVVAALWALVSLRRRSS